MMNVFAVVHFGDKDQVQIFCKNVCIISQIGWFVVVQIIVTVTFPFLLINCTNTCMVSFM